MIPARHSAGKMNFDVRQAVSEIFVGISGFGHDTVGPGGRRLRRGTALVYGELTPTGIDQLAAAAKLTADDVFVDLGSGTGRIVIQIAATIPGIRCIGVEIVGSRHQAAVGALEWAEQSNLIRPGACVLRHEDILKTDLSDATVIFANSTCFSPWLMSRIVARIAPLPQRPLFISLRGLDSGNAERKLPQIDKSFCETTWNAKIAMNIFQARPRRAAKPVP
jgi:hypothetical protein